MSQPISQQSVFTTKDSQPLIEVSVKEDGKTVVYYFKTQKKADSFLKRHESIQKALDAAGSWSDIDFDDMLDELDKIRHQSKPTPLFDPDK